MHTQQGKSSTLQAQKRVNLHHIQDLFQENEKMGGGEEMIMAEWKCLKGREFWILFYFIKLESAKDVPSVSFSYHYQTKILFSS